METEAYDSRMQVAASVDRGRFVRTLGVIILATFFFGLAVSNLVFGLSPFGNGFLGFSFNADDLITGVDTGTSAAAAGLRPGDHINAAAMPFGERIHVLTTTPAAAGSAITLPIVRNGRDQNVTLKYEPYPTSYWYSVVLLKRITMLVFLIVGALLVIYRPSAMTWAFLVFAWTSTFASPFILSLADPSVYLVVNIIWDVLVGAAGPAAFLLFALYFPTKPNGGWRVGVSRLIAPLFVLLAAFIAWLDLRYYVLTQPAQYGTELSRYIGFAVLALGAFSLLITYFQSRGQERLRIKWVVVGLVIGAIVNVVIALATDPNIVRSPIVASYAQIIETLQIVVPITVAYAVLRHRLLDINFIVSRTIVYGTLTSAIVATFILLDWFFTREFANSSVGLLAELSVALVMGVTLNGAHKRLDQAVDALLFRHRHLAERRLARVASALPLAKSTELVDEMLVEEPAHALQLASAALFWRAEDGRYVRSRSVGWAQEQCTELGVNDPLTLQVEAEQAPLRVDEIRWPRVCLPAGVAHPVLAVPVVVRRRVAGIVLYGSHLGGEDIDPDEIKGVVALAVAAAAAYDHLEADRLRAQIEEMSRELKRMASAGLRETLVIQPTAAPST